MRGRAPVRTVRQPAMRLATLKDGSRDGRLAVVRRDGAALVPAAGIAPSLQAALDGWARCEPLLRALAGELDSGRVSGEPVVFERLHARCRAPTSGSTARRSSTT